VQRNPCEKLPDTWLKEQSSLLGSGNPGQLRKLEGKMRIKALDMCSGST
jgi:hypothetical protein